MTDPYASMLEDGDTEKLVIDVLAEFFQGSFDEDSSRVTDWLVKSGTSPDDFIHLVVALRRRLSPLLLPSDQCGGGA